MGHTKQLYSKSKDAYFGSLICAGGSGRSDTLWRAATHSEREFLDANMCLNCFDTRDSCSRSIGRKLLAI